MTSILEDLSIKITIRTIKNIVFQDYILINSIEKSKKLALISKITLVVWQYCHRYINLLVNIVIISILSLYLLIKFTLPALLTGFFALIFIYLEYRFLKFKSKEQNQNYSKALDEINSNLLDIINLTKEIKLNNKEEYFIKKAYESCKKFSNLNKQRSFYDVFHIYFTEITIMVCFIIILASLFYTTNFNNSLLISSISTVCAVVLRMTPALNRAQSSMYLINSNEKLALELLEFDEKYYQKNAQKVNEKLPFSTSIELKNISFSYDGTKSGLSNINLKINKNDFIGIVGLTGCYKTTLCLIIAGLIKAQKGQILIDNKELKEENKDAWRNNFAFLSQNFTLFDDLKFDKKYLKALNLDFTNSNYNELSNGQKQILALLNILQKDSEILILDEITSSLDVISQEKINNILKTLKGKKTIISIAHRLQILKHATKIVYMKEGNIVDIDTFNNLSNKYFEFREFVELSNFKIN